MSRPPDQNTARIIARIICHHLQWGEVEKAREEAAKAIRRGEPMTAEVCDAIVAALAPPAKKRGRQKHPYPRRWFTIGMEFLSLRRQGKTYKESIEHIAATGRFGGEETIENKVEYFNKRWPALQADMQRRAEEMERRTTGNEDDN